MTAIQATMSSSAKEQLEAKRSCAVYVALAQLMSERGCGFGFPVHNNKNITPFNHIYEHLTLYRSADIWYKPHLSFLPTL